MSTMAEDNARDMDELRKLRHAHEALRIVIDETRSGKDDLHLDSYVAARRYLRNCAERIEAVWN